MFATPAVPTEYPPSPVRLERAAEVASRVGLHRQRIYALIRRGEFPAPVRIHGRSVAWHAHEVDAWIASRPRVSNPEKTNAPAGTGASLARV